MAKKAHPWERLPDEEDSSWKRFLCYLHLGPRRSVRACYRTLMNLEKGAKPTPAYYDDFDRFDWRARADAYDIHHLKKSGGRVVALQVAVQEASLRFVLRSLSDPACRAKSNAELRETLDAIAKVVPDDTVRLFLTDAGVLREEVGDGGGGAELLDEVPPCARQVHAGCAGGDAVVEAGTDREAAPDAPLQGAGEG